MPTVHIYHTVAHGGVKNLFFKSGIVHNIKVAFKICHHCNHRVATPVRYGGGYDVVCRIAHGNSSAAAAVATSLCGVGNVFFKLWQNCCHTHFIAQITYCNVEYAHFLDFIKEYVCLCFKVRGVFTNCIVKFTHTVFTGEFIGNNCRRLAMGKYFISLCFCLLLVCCKGDNAH